MNGANRTVLIVGAALALTALVLVIGSSVNGGGSGSPSSSTTQNQEQRDAEVAEPSGKNYDMTIDEFEALLDSYDSHVSTGENARSAATSSQVPTVETLSQEMSQRGFTEVGLQADFDINGSYIGAQELDGASTEKYPSYAMPYVSEQGVFWMVYVNDGSYLAVPMKSLDGASLSRQIILSETDYVTQYDGSKNEYSDFSLSSINDAVAVRVAHIDRKTLDSYTVSELEAL